MARPKSKIDFRLLAKVSKLYYEDNLNQDDIVSRLHISRSTISRLLAQAREEGIVVVPPWARTLNWKRPSKRNMPSIVTDVSSPESPQMIARGLGAAAANYLLCAINEMDVVSVSWGYTLRGMVAALELFGNDSRSTRTGFLCITPMAAWTGLYTIGHIFYAR